MEPVKNDYEDFIATPSLLPATLLVALIAAVVPFFVSVRSTSSSSLNGTVVSASFIDYVAVAGGGVAVVLGALSLLPAARNKDRRAVRIAICSGVSLLGVIQLLRGFGIVA